ARCIVLFTGLDAVPGRQPEIGVLCGVLGVFQHIRRDIALRKVRDRIAARFEQQPDLLAFGDPAPTEAYPQAPAQSLDIEQSLRQRLGHEKAADGSRRKRTLLPGQSHCTLSIWLTGAVRGLAKPDPTTLAKFREQTGFSTTCYDPNECIKLPEKEITDGS